MEAQFKIGEISEIFHISVRTLHLYDKIGLFRPQYTDRDTGYRYYTAAQLQLLDTILALKIIGFSLNEIKEVCQHCLSNEEFNDMLEMKKTLWRNQTEIARYNIDSIRMMKSAAEASAQNKCKPADIKHAVSQSICRNSFKTENELFDLIWL